MISLLVNDETVDITDNASFNIGASSPFLNPGEISGSKIYNLAARKTRRNQKIFSFAEQLNNIARVKEFRNATIKFYNLLWKQGTLKLRDFSGNYNLSFHSDAGDIGIKIKNRKLPDIDLGTVPADGNMTSAYPTANHIHLKVKAPDFYGDKNLDYGGIINNHDGIALYTNSTTNQYNIVPFPFLLFVLTKVFQDLGYYGIEGSWTEDLDVRRVVLYNNYDLASMSGGINVFGTTITYANHVPNISVGSFLIDTAIMFGITYIVNPVTKKVRIERIKDWLNNPAYLNLNGRASGNYKLEPNQNDGFSFFMSNGNDPFVERKGWLTHKLGNGAEEVKTEAGTLEHDGIDPITGETGRGPAFELDTDNQSALRFLLHTGPGTGHYLKTGFSLRWSGADGIAARCYQEWMDWKSYTEAVEREVDLNVVELLQLDLERKIMIDNLKYVVGEYQGSISNDGKRKPVKLQLYNIRK